MAQTTPPGPLLLWFLKKWNLVYKTEKLRLTGTNDHFHAVDHFTVLLLFLMENFCACYQISHYLMGTANNHQPKHKICCTTYLFMLHESGRKEKKLRGKKKNLSTFSMGNGFAVPCF